MITDVIGVDNLVRFVCVVVLAWTVPGLYQYYFVNRSYEWLMIRFLSHDCLREIAPAKPLHLIETRNGCTEFTFMRLVMRPILNGRNNQG